jgi:phosphoglycerate dehydrogenase-like enzyme
VMKSSDRVAVCSRSFSSHPILREELLSNFSHVSFNDSGITLAGAELVRFLSGHQKAIVALETLDKSTLSKLPDLKVIGKYGVGLDKLDLRAMDEFQVQMGWTPGVNAQSVAELTVALALNIVRNIYVSRDLVKSQGWKQITGRQLTSMTFGILGCGHVGKAVVKLLRPFGCKIVAHDILDFKEFYQQYDVRSVSFDELLQQADIFSIHLPKNEQTKDLLGRTSLSLLKKGSYLINTARGGLVDEGGLLELLNSGHLAGAALDVFAEEPPKDWTLIQHPSLFVTSHIGGSSEEAILAMGRAAIFGLNHFKKASEYEKF